MVTPTKRMLSQLKKGPFVLEELEPGIRLPPGVSAATVRNIIENASVKKDDVFVATYPKCGTTWMQQIVKLIWNNGVEDNRDVDEALPWTELMTIEEIGVIINSASIVNMYSFFIGCETTSWIQNSLTISLNARRHSFSQHTCKVHQCVSQSKGCCSFFILSCSSYVWRFYANGLEYFLPAIYN